jgi:hypothetical protein
MAEPTKTIIERIRQEIGCGRQPTRDVLILCERAESLLNISGRLETALHEAIKTIEEKE